MMNDEKIVLAKLKAEMVKKASQKSEAGYSWYMHPEDVLGLIAQYESELILGFNDEGLPFSITEGTND